MHISSDDPVPCSNNHHQQFSKRVPARARCLWSKSELARKTCLLGKGFLLDECFEFIVAMNFPGIHVLSDSIGRGGGGVDRWCMSDRTAMLEVEHVPPVMVTWLVRAHSPTTSYPGASCALHN